MGVSTGPLGTRARAVAGRDQKRVRRTLSQRSGMTGPARAARRRHLDELVAGRDA
jgi:hypothetical protein